MSRKLFIIDLDGTLLHNNKIANKKDVEVLKKVQENGHGVIINSGRSWLRSNKIAKQLNCDLYDNLLICNNGAYYSKVTEYKPENVFIFEYKNIEGFINLLNELKVTFIFIRYDILNKMFVVNDSLEYKNISKDLQYCHFIKNEKDFIYYFKNVTMIYTSFNPNNHKQIQIMNTIDHEIKKYSKYINSSKATNVNGINIDYMICNVNSSKGLQANYIVNKLNIKENNIYVFGDGGNDISLFKMFENSVAMGNANDEIKNYTKYVCKTNLEGGISDFILKHKLDKMD